ncbi:hypothetical protein KORDIASMS9_01638 [Kordia sp. SMS9]|uniref:hypothetical protein n=1 Tax=Kordia sp. SMS9 TaxID=2282170 RepID=UPI000E0DCBCF|nr:hypothetical protein [Kordia sp. SMS9]AXG69416.1 hypothetical protein KORDIASMS9_01638 [Kordia sp. SMS9]
MKKQKLKLGLQKSSISNLQKLNSIKGGTDSNLSVDIICVDTSVYSDVVNECEETYKCETNGGYICGETARLNCQI